jgi:hypothetical protein
MIRKFAFFLIGACPPINQSKEAKKVNIFKFKIPKKKSKFQKFQKIFKKFQNSKIS